VEEIRFGESDAVRGTIIALGSLDDGGLTIFCGLHASGLIEGICVAHICFRAEMIERFTGLGGRIALPTGLLRGGLVVW
jgi:hypothetical protein